MIVSSDRRERTERSCWGALQPGAASLEPLTSAKDAATAAKRERRAGTEVEGK